ncbi:MAG: hypothetical protein CM1200mP6_10420 [Anaerolineaceae bacterium]|nr:MAG: hypothetical protein CM1200mP6_10420 [Anaerolineaceae bacterium]
MSKRRHSILDVLTSALLYATMMVGGIYLYIFVGSAIVYQSISTTTGACPSRFGYRNTYSNTYVYTYFGAD